MSEHVARHASPADARLGNHKLAFGQVMGELAHTRGDLAVVVADYGRRLGLERFRALCPEGYVQCGIAEQNQVEVASALANEGFVTFAPTYATFITARVLDQVRVNLGIMGSPVMLVGVGCGCEAGPLGPSHMAIEDLGCMRQIPGMTVASPVDVEEFMDVLRDLAEHPRPAYVRMNDDAGARLLPVGADPLAPCWLRRGDGARVALVACGTVAAFALAAADLLAERSTMADVLALPTLKPWDDAPVRQLSGYEVVVTVEEHAAIGGLGSAVAEALAQMGGGPRLVRLGMPDRYLEADVRARLLERAGLDAAGIARTASGALGRSASGGS